MTPWTIAHQASLSMEFSKQEYCSGLPFTSPGAIPNPGIEPMYHALAGGFFTTDPPVKPKCLSRFTEGTRPRYSMESASRSHCKKSMWDGKHWWPSSLNITGSMSSWIFSVSSAADAHQRTWTWDTKMQTLLPTTWFPAHVLPDLLAIELQTLYLQGPWPTQPHNHYCSGLSLS